MVSLLRFFLVLMLFFVVNAKTDWTYFIVMPSTTQLSNEEIKITVHQENGKKYNMAVPLNKVLCPARMEKMTHSRIKYIEAKCKRPLFKKCQSSPLEEIYFFSVYSDEKAYGHEFFCRREKTRKNNDKIYFYQPCQNALSNSVQEERQGNYLHLITRVEKIHGFMQSMQISIFKEDGSVIDLHVPKNYRDSTINAMGSNSPAEYIRVFADTATLNNLEKIIVYLEAGKFSSFCPLLENITGDHQIIKYKKCCDSLSCPALV